jgi:hypothetical protein
MPLSKPAGLPELPGWARAAGLLAAGVVFAGVADFLLSAAGRPGLGAVVWVVGYGGAVLAVWLLVFRGREFEPGGVPETEADDDANASASAGAPTGSGAVPEGYAPSPGSTGERKG